MLQVICAGLLCLVLASCNTDKNMTLEENVLTIRLAGEPDNLNPTRSRSTYATPIESLIMYPLAEYDPVSFELSPLIVKSLASTELIEEGPCTGGTRFTYEMREEAEWDDGTPVTGHDYAFTIKMSLNPRVDAATLRGFLSFIKDVEIDPNNPKKFTATVPEAYMLAEVITCNFNIFPKHIYDPNGYMDHITVAELADEQSSAQLAESDSSLQKFADAFASVGFNRDTVSGCGPYTLVEWVTGEHIILERKKDWWGDKVKDAPALMAAYPERIDYRVIADETMALSALKDGTIDFMAEVSPANFLEMKADAQWAEILEFHSPAVMMYDYLELNNRHPMLRDRKVRAALAHAIDYNAIMDAINLGMAQRTVGPFHPDKEYYNDELVVPEYNIERSRELLAQAGWEDTNQDGTVDKELEGQRSELNLDIVVSQRELGQQIALLVKESAAKAGIDIDIVTKDNSSWVQAVRKREFEILPMRSRTSPAINDPYQTWHSESDVPGGSNRSGFRSAVADSLIDMIRVAKSEEERNHFYMEFQETIHEEQPVIFLYVPLERMIVNRKFEMTPSSRRPGYFENLFKLRDQK